MDTKIVSVDPKQIDVALMRELGRLISEGQLVAFPTETVYGLGANAFSEEAVSRIFVAKGRPSDNPLIVHVSCLEEVYGVAAEVPPAAKLLFEKFSPGPITIILKKSSFIPRGVTAGLDTVAVRIPAHPVALALIRESTVPIAAPSANRSGKPSPTEAAHVIADMDGRIAAIIDGGNSSVGVESTVIDMTGECPVILRPGGITAEDIRVLLPNVQIDQHVLKSLEGHETPKSPGMKYKHYAPDAEVFVVEGKQEDVRRKTEELILEYRDKRIGVIVAGGGDYAVPLIFRVQDNRDYANKLFGFLREFDKQNIEIVFAQVCYDDSYALAVKNRLYKSAANRVFKV